MIGQELQRLFVNIKGDGTHLHNTLSKGIAGIQQFAAAAQQMGAVMTAAFTAPAIAIGSFSVREFGNFEQQINNIRAAANPTAEQLKQLKAAIESTAAATGMDPSKVAAGFGELVKAGTSVEAVLGGIGASVIKFARVGEMEMATAAKVIVNAMTQFGGTAEEMANVISRAADASTIGIADVAAAFSTGGGALKQFNQNAKDVSAAIAILGNAGIAGADAGTSLKSMFITALSGAGEAEKVIKKFGLQFRDAAGQVKPMAALIEEVQSKLGGLGQAAQDQALFSLFGSYGFRAAAALLKTGAKGFDEFKASMDSALPVSEKFAIVTAGLLEQWEKVKVSLSLAAASIGEVLAPVLELVAGWTKEAADWFRELSPTIKKVIVVVGAAIATIGPILLAVGTAIGVALGAIAGVIASISAVIDVVAAIGAAIGAVALPELLLAVASAAALIAAPFIVAGLAIWGFVKASGGWAGAWEKIKGAAQSFIDWIRPVWNAMTDFLMEFWPLLEDLAAGTWEAISDFASGVFDLIRWNLASVLGDSEMTWTQIRDFIVGAFEFATFAVSHFEEVSTLAATAVLKTFLDMADKLTFGLASAIDDMTLGLGESFKEQRDAVTQHFMEWKRMRQKAEEAVAGAPAEAPPALKKMTKEAAKLGKETGKEFKKAMSNELERIEGVAAGSAEGLFQTAAYRQRLRNLAPQVQPDVFNPTAKPQPVANLGENKAIGLLEDIKKILHGKDKIGIDINTANLDH